MAIGGIRAAELARLLGISRARVSQLVAEGRLEGAYAGEGRHRRFDLKAAAACLDRTLDAGQVMANGAEAADARCAIGADADPRDEAGATAPIPAEDDNDAVGDRYRRARAEKAEMEAIRARIGLALDQGRYVLASEVELATRRALADEIAGVESMLRDAARALAAEHGLDPVAVRTTLFASWRAHRGRRATAAAGRAATAAPSPSETEEMQVA